MTTALQLVAMVETQPADTRPARFMTLLALLVALATDAAYVLLIHGLATQALDAFTVPFVAAYLLVLAGLLMVSRMRLRNPAWRAPLRAAAASGLLVLGVLAIFSIGLPLIGAGAMASGATVRSMRRPLRSRSSIAAVAAAALAVAVLGAGFEVTERLIVCPAHGSASGGGTGFVTGPYHYECANGQLTFHSGS